MFHGYFQDEHFDDAVQLHTFLGKKKFMAVFSKMDMFYKDVVSWSLIIFGFVRIGLMSDTLYVFEKMVVKNVI